MNEIITHLEANARRIAAELVAYNSQVSEINSRVNDAAVAVSQAEVEFPGDNARVAPYRETLRKAKQERAGIRRPAHGDPWPDVKKWRSFNPKAVSLGPLKPDIRKGETALQAHNNHREVTNDILAKIKGVDAAPAPASELRTTFEAQICEMAKAPQIGKFGVQLPKSVIPVGTSAITINDAMAFMCWAFKDQVLAAFDKLVSNDDKAMSASDRAATLDKLKTDLVKSLRLEAACAMQAEKDGQRVERRRNIHPAIICNCAIDPSVAYKHLVGPS